MTSRSRRVLVGSLGMLVGLAGLAGIFLEQRAARERERVLRALASDFRKHDAPPSTESAVVWEGRTFRPGDRVRIAKWAGTFKPADTGAAAEVNAGPGGTGVIVRGERRRSRDQQAADEPIQIVRVRWSPQRWQVLGSEELLELPQFESTIHASYLEHVP